MADRCEHAPVWLVEFADNGTIVYANETLAGWLGETAAALVGRKFESILTLANRIFLQTHFYPLLTLHGHAEEIFLALHKADGTSIPVVAAARRCTTNAIPSIECAFLTVHQRRRYEQEILEAKRVAEEAVRSNAGLLAAKTQLETQARALERKLREEQVRTEDLERAAQILSHDLREPLRKIGLFADLVRGPVQTLDDLEPVEALRKIDVEAKRMEGLLVAMRELLEPDALDAIEKIALSQLVERAATAVAMKLGFSDWTVTCESLPEIEGRRARLLLVPFPPARKLYQVSRAIASFARARARTRRPGKRLCHDQGALSLRGFRASRDRGQRPGFRSQVSRLRFPSAEEGTSRNSRTRRRSRALPEDRSRASRHDPRRPEARRWGDLHPAPAGSTGSAHADATALILQLENAAAPGAGEGKDHASYGARC
jgi:PAS domain S-box-containing protein